MKNTISLRDLKNNIDILEVASQYCKLKKVNHNCYMAVVNVLRDEKTSSLYFYVDTGKWYDFGSSEGGDGFDFISKCENISLSDAIQKLKNGYIPSKIPIRKKPQHTQVLEISSEQLQEEFNKFENIDVNNSKHYTELLNVVPEYLFKESNETDLSLFLSCTRYDNRNNTLVAGWYKNSHTDFEMITYKRRRLNGGKWINRKSTHPNQTVFNRIFDDTKPVYIIEGARDAITAILLGLNFVAIPTTSFKNHSLLSELIKPSDEVIFICEDMQGYKSMSYLSGFIPQSRLLTFIQNRDEKIDLSDYVMNQTSLKGVTDAISA